MFKIKTLNAISSKGLQLFPTDDYEVSSECAEPDAILLRSADMHAMDIPASVQAIGRAGSGVNNIPVDTFSQRGIPVFNTPGANANAVKELVFAGLLLASRNICAAWNYVNSITTAHDMNQTADVALAQQVEKNKKQFAGTELVGKTLGIIGLGNIGVKVANLGLALGMRVLGYDPTITTHNAWELSSGVERAFSLDHLLMQADFVSLHVPLITETRGLLNASRLQVMKKGSVLLNFAREALVEPVALLQALAEKHLAFYVNDFPNRIWYQNSQVISLPHLGASTKEAEENCATMIVKQIRNFLEFGTILNAVNFPSVDMPWNGGFRLALVNANVPNMVAQISAKLANAQLNIVDLINKSKGNLAYTLLDLSEPVKNDVLQELIAIEGVIQVRYLADCRNKMQTTQGVLG